MPNKLCGKRIAILATDGVEQVEMTEPRKALDAAGARTELVSPAKGKLQAWQHMEKGDKFPVDLELDAADPNNYDALVLPGGVANPDQLRTMPKAFQFVKSFLEQDKPVAAICHAPWMLVEADVVRGRTLTSWPSLHTDLKNAGAKWVDREVGISANLNPWDPLELITGHNSRARSLLRPPDLTQQHGGLFFEVAVLRNEILELALRPLDIVFGDESLR
jgi:protease I